MMKRINYKILIMLLLIIVGYSMYPDIVLCEQIGKIQFLENDIYIEFDKTSGLLEIWANYGGQRIQESQEDISMVIKDDKGNYQYIGDDYTRLEYEEDSPMLNSRYYGCFHVIDYLSLDPGNYFVGLKYKDEGGNYQTVWKPVVIDGKVEDFFRIPQISFSDKDVRMEYNSTTKQIDVWVNNNGEQIMDGLENVSLVIKDQNKFVYTGDDYTRLFFKQNSPKLSNRYYRKYDVKRYLKLPGGVYTLGIKYLGNDGEYYFVWPRIYIDNNLTNEVTISYESNFLSPDRSRLISAKLKELYKGGKLSILHKPIINGVKYYIVEMNNLKFDNNFSIVSDIGTKILIIDQNWGLVTAKDIITKSIVIWRANRLYTEYYKDIVTGKGNYLINEYKENLKSRNTYVFWSFITEGCKKITAFAVTGGAEAAASSGLKAAIKETITGSSKAAFDSAVESSSDLKNWAKALAMLDVEAYMLEYHEYAKGLDSYYQDMVKKGKLDIDNFDDASQYITLTYRASLLPSVIDLQIAVDGRKEASTNGWSYAKNYVVDIMKDVIMLSAKNHESWLQNTIKGDFLKKCLVMLETGDYMGFAGQMATKSAEFRDFIESENRCGERIKQDISTGYDVSYNSKIIGKM